MHVRFAIPKEVDQVEVAEQAARLVGRLGRRAALRVAFYRSHNGKDPLWAEIAMHIERAWVLAAVGT